MADGSAPSVKTAVTERGNQDHPFFHYYGLLPHQQNMLQDAVRTGTYKNAITLVCMAVGGGVGGGTPIQTSGLDRATTAP